MSLFFSCLLFLHVFACCCCCWGTGDDDHRRQGPVSCLQTKLPDWEPRTRLAALKTLTVQGSADYVRVTTGMAACLMQRALDDWQANDKATGGEVTTIAASSTRAVWVLATKKLLI